VQQNRKRKFHVPMITYMIHSTVVGSQNSTVVGNRLKIDSNFYLIVVNQSKFDCGRQSIKN